MSATPILKQTVGANTTTTDVYGAFWTAGTFVPTGTWLTTDINVYMVRSGATGTVTVSIKAVDGSHKPTGPDLAIGSVDTSGWSTSFAWHDIPLNTPIWLTQGTEYALVVRLPSGDASHLLHGYYGAQSSRTYWASSDSGATWPTSASNNSLSFQIYGTNVPVVSTGNAINLTATSSILQGTIDVIGDYSPLYARFDWGLTTSYGNSTGEQIINPAAAIPFYATLTRLTPGATYHFRAAVRYI